MQDLKKQTAMRLAHEQQHRRNGPEGMQQYKGQTHHLGQPEEHGPSVSVSYQNLGDSRDGTHGNAQYQNPPQPHRYEYQARSQYPLQNELDYQNSYNVVDHRNQERPATVHFKPNYEMWQQPRELTDGETLPTSNPRSADSDNAFVALPRTVASPLSQPPTRFYSEACHASDFGQKQHGSGYQNVGTAASSVSQSQFQQFSSPTRVADTHTQQTQQNIKFPQQQKLCKKKQQRQQQLNNPDIVQSNEEAQHDSFEAAPAGTPSKTFPMDQPQRGGKFFHRNVLSSAAGNSFQPNGITHHQQTTPPPASQKQRSGGAKQSKLPHGLTVHELKEMTKARLQAEAAERNEQDIDQEQHQQVQQQPGVMLVHQQHFQQHQSPKLSTAATASGVRENVVRQNQQPYVQHRQNSMDSSASAPPAVLQPQSQGTGPIYRTLSHQALGDHLSSSQPPFVQNFASPGRPVSNSQQPQDRSGTNLQQQNQLFQTNSNRQRTESKEWKQPADAFETASVTSLNSTLGSEYLGSESAYSMGLGGFQPHASAATLDDNGSMPFGRSRSYPTGGSVGSATELQQSYEVTPTSTVTTSSSFFEASVGGGPNRRRTATLSPPGLSHLHEDRPLTIGGAGGEDLSIPSFDAPQMNQLTALVNSVEICGSPPISRGSSPANFRAYQNSGVIGGGLNDILGTHPSLAPKIAAPGETGIEKPKDTILPLPLGNDRAFSSGGMSMNADLPNSVAESVLVTPLVNEGRKVVVVDSKEGQQLRVDNSSNNDVSAVFRNNFQVGEGESSSHQPPREQEMTLTSTSSGGFLLADAGVPSTSPGGFLFSDACVIGGSADAASVTSWGGSTGALSNSAGLPVGVGAPGMVSNISGDLNNIASPPASEEVFARSTANLAGESNHRRVPSLISRIDPEVDLSTTTQMNQNASFSSFNEVGVAPLNNLEEGFTLVQSTSTLDRDTFSSSDVAQRKNTAESTSTSGSSLSSSSSKTNTVRWQNKKSGYKNRRKNKSTKGAGR